MTDGRWTVDRPEIRVDPIPRIQRESITMQDIEEFGATVGCPGCNAIKENTRAERIEECAERWIEEVR